MKLLFQVFCGEISDCNVLPSGLCYKTKTNLITRTCFDEVKSSIHFVTCSFVNALCCVCLTAIEMKKLKEREKVMKHQEKVRKQEHARMEREMRASQIIEVWITQSIQQIKIRSRWYA